MTLIKEQPPQHLGPQYYDQLDGLRFISVFGVLLQHLINPKVSHFFLSGNGGVDLFFVISGFLITENLLLLRQSHSFGKGIKVFYVRRMLRIFPLYFLYWAILLIFFYGQVNDHKWWGLLYVINYYDIYHALPTLTGHLWSLSVEEQFYIVWPFLVFIATSRHIIKFTVVLLILALIFFGINLYNAPPEYNYFHTFSCSLALLTGAVLACLKNMKRDRLNVLLKYSKWLSFIALPVFLIISVLYGLGKIEDRYLVLIRICMCIIGFYLVGRVAVNPFTGRWGRFLQLRWIQRTGQMAYGIYIYHYLVLYIIQPYLTTLMHKLFSYRAFDSGILRYLRYNTTIIAFPVVIVFVLFLAWVSYKYFETYFLTLKKYFI